jgi:hypothetical protein
VRILHGLDCILGGESSHYQSQFAIGRRLNGQAINAQDVLRSVCAAAVHFYDELDVFQHFGVPSLVLERSSAEICLAAHANLELTSTRIASSSRGNPRLIRRAFAQISPQDGEKSFR